MGASKKYAHFLKNRKLCKWFSKLSELHRKKTCRSPGGHYSTESHKN